ncbi:MAG: KEOPS complex subunit Cgi121 [Candidatus Heimdallarchaeota archaeon]
MTFNYGNLTTHIIGISETQINDVEDVLRQIKRLATVKGVILQLVDANRVAGKEHLKLASYHAKKAFQHNNQISNSLEIETLLYATGQRQIDKALTLIGITPKTKNVAVIVLFPPDKSTNRSELFQEIINLLKGKQSKTVFNLTPEKERALIRLFDISTEELKTGSIHDLIIERMGMLELTKRPPTEILKS